MATSAAAAAPTDEKEKAGHATHDIRIFPNKKAKATLRHWYADYCKVYNACVEIQNSREWQQGWAQRSIKPSEKWLNHVAADMAKARDAVRAAQKALEDAIMRALPPSGAPLNARSTAAVDMVSAPLQKKLDAATTKLQRLEEKETAALCTHADAIKAAERAEALKENQPVERLPLNMINVNVYYVGTCGKENFNTLYADAKELAAVDKAAATPAVILQDAVLDFVAACKADIAKQKKRRFSSDRTVAKEMQPKRPSQGGCVPLRWSLFSGKTADTVACGVFNGMRATILTRIGTKTSSFDAAARRSRGARKTGGRARRSRNFRRRRKGRRSRGRRCCSTAAKSR
jgi:hypothetical protein